MALSAAALLKKLNLLECHRSHRSPWLQTPVWRRRTNQICYYWFSEIFHVLCHGFCCIFSVRIISVAEKDLHVVNSNFLSPSYSFFALQSDATIFDLIDQFPTYGCCRYKQHLVSFWVFHTCWLNPSLLAREHCWWDKHPFYLFT